MRAWVYLVCLSLAGCTAAPSAESKATPRAVSVSVTPCTRRAVHRTVELPGDVYPYRQAQLYARTSGYLQTMRVDRGDRVTEGELLATLRLPEAHRELAQAQANYSRGQSELQAARERLPRARAERASTESDYHRALAQQEQLTAELGRIKAQEQQAMAEQRLAEANRQRLLGIAKEDAGLVAAQDLDVSKTSVEVAQQKVLSAHSAVLAAQESLAACRSAVTAARNRVEVSSHSVSVAAAQLNSSGFQGQADLQAARKAADLLSYTEIRAPFAGTITARYLDPGALVQSSDRTAQQTTRPVLALADFDKVRVRVELPQEVALLADRGTPAEVRVGEQVFRAHVSRTSGSLDNAARTMVAEVDVKNPRHLLRPGMYVKVVLDVGSHPNVLAVPAQAVQTERTSRLVYVARDGQARAIKIEPGLENEDWIEVKSGLKESDMVVLTSAQKLFDGMSVDVTGPVSH